MYLLDLFCNSPNPGVRAKSAELFNKMMADKLVGPKVKITLSKFLPTIFMDAMRENPEVSVHMFEGRMVVILWHYDCRLHEPDGTSMFIWNTLHCDFIVGMHENPELVWNDESREKVCNVVKKERSK